MERSDAAGAQPADRRERISIRCAPSPRRKLTRP